MSKKNFTDSVNWAQMRKDAGLTLQQVAEVSGYGVATINGLEKRGEGSGRLKALLASIYGVHPDYAANPGVYKEPFLIAKAAAEALNGTQEEKNQEFNRVMRLENAKIQERQAGWEAAHSIQEQEVEYQIADWKQRALDAERKLAALQAILAGDKETKPKKKKNP